MSVEPAGAANPGGLRLRFALTDNILRWATGEVVTDKMFSGPTRQTLVEGGLFCPEIFGAENDTGWSCGCGALTQNAATRSGPCSRCGLPVVRGRCRSRRLGRIQLAVPVLHVWYLRSGSSPGPAATILGLPQQTIEALAYCERYVDLRPQSVALAELPLLKPAEAEVLLRDPALAADIRTGADAIEELLRRASRPSEQNAVAPEAMILRAIAVLPPELRPVSELASGRQTIHPLNDLYQQVIARSNDLAKQIQNGRGRSVIRERTRDLQLAVEALLDNRLAKEPALDAGGRRLPSVADQLAGKQGLFRQQLLGKRVDYSARAVIVAGPELRLDQVGIPRAIARVLFRPLLVRAVRQAIRHLTGFDPASSVLLAERLLDGDPLALADALPDVSERFRGAKARAARALLLAPDLVDRMLDLVTPGRRVLINRAPTLHRMNFQAFEPVLTGGHAVRLHPLACAGFAADFDGDTVAVHAPLTRTANAEAAKLLPSANFLSPAQGRPVYLPSQEMIMGCYYLTANPSAGSPGRLSGGCGEIVRIPGAPERVGLFRALVFPDRNEVPRFSVPVFADSDAAIRAFKQGRVGVHDWVLIRLPSRKRVYADNWSQAVMPSVGFSRRVLTTAGRVLFNAALPAGFAFHNRTIDRDRLTAIVAECHDPGNPEVAAATVDRLMCLGFRWATQVGLSLTPDDLPTRDAARDAIVAAADAKGTARVTTAWETAQKELRKWLTAALAKRSPLGGVRIMLESGALKKWQAVQQLAAPRGLMSRASGPERVVPEPIRSSLRDGLSPREFFLSAFGARKAGFDKGRPLRDSGYLARQLAFALQHLRITEKDCGTTEGLDVPPAEAVGRIACRTVELDGGQFVAAGELITRGIADTFRGKKAAAVRVRSAITCRAARGICCACYGDDPGTRRPVRIGTAVGVIAAQSLSEPGTQLAMKTKHEGGVAAGTGGLGAFTQLNRLLAGPPSDKDTALPPAADRVRAIFKLYRDNGIVVDHRHVEVAVAAMCRGSAGEGDARIRRGIKAAAQTSDSFLAAAAFEQPRRVLQTAALQGRVDPLFGPRERQIVGVPTPSREDET